MGMFPASREEGEAFRERSDHREIVRTTDRQHPSDRAFHHSAGVIDACLAGGPVRGRFLLQLRRGNNLAVSGPVRMCSRLRIHFYSQPTNTQCYLVVQD